MVSMDSHEWGELLRTGLGVDVLSLGGVSPMLLSIFRFGPFSLAYPDFPAGRRHYRRDHVEDVLAAARSRGVDAVRFHSECDLPISPSRIRALGTVRIADLGTWRAASFEKARRARNRALRSPLHIEPACAGDGAALHQLYVATLGRHRGSLRYTEEYFRAIAEATTIVARMDGRICGFVSSAILEDRACYLHGAHDPRVREHHPSDQLFYTMILAAQKAGASSFDFLPSPPGQHSLVKYKQAWGGQSSPFLVTDVALRPIRAATFDLMRELSNRLPARFVARLSRR